MMKNKIFLLGGHDLEMITIRRLLEENSIDYIDKKLSWGAKLSDYGEVLEDNKKYEQIYGIELDEDIKPPKNYTSIDHHGERETECSSLEQVALVIGYKLSVEEKLIAANDKGYIREMYKLTDNFNEIKSIRQLDRSAQGVTTKDEKLARESFDTRIWKETVCVIESKTNKFSAVTDIFYLTGEGENLTKSLIVYNKETLCYYGSKKNNIVTKLSENYKLFHGGGSDGYLA